MGRQIVMSEEYLKKMFDFSASSLVGKLMKRFEIHDDPKVIKAEMKEMTYEHFRGLKENLLAFDNGVSFSWDFKSNKK